MKLRASVRKICEKCRLIRRRRIQFSLFFSLASSSYISRSRSFRFNINYVTTPNR